MLPSLATTSVFSSDCAVDLLGMLGGVADAGVASVSDRVTAIRVMRMSPVRARFMRTSCWTMRAGVSDIRRQIWPFVASEMNAARPNNEKWQRYRLVRCDARRHVSGSGGVVKNTSSRTIFICKAFCDSARDTRAYVSGRDHNGCWTRWPGWSTV